MDLELLHRAPQGAARPHPLLFVHGAWHAAWCWEEHFLGWFAARGYDCWALSLRGHGKSDGAMVGARVRDYVDDVASVVARLPGPPVLVGHSMGGFVLQHYLAAHEAPAGVLLASVPPFGVRRITGQLAVRHPGLFVRANLFRDLGLFVREPALVREMFFSAGAAEDEVARVTGRLSSESYRAFLDMLAFDLPTPGRVRTPLLVVGGGVDEIFVPREVEATARAYGTTAVMMPGMAHDLMLEPGWAEVAERVAGWIEARGAAGEVAAA